MSSWRKQQLWSKFFNLGKSRDLIQSHSTSSECSSILRNHSFSRSIGHRHVRFTFIWKIQWKFREFCAGGSLSDLIKDSNKEIKTSLFKKILLGTAKGIGHLHKNNFVHRDIAGNFHRNFLLRPPSTKYFVNRRFGSESFGYFSEISDLRSIDFGMSRKIQDNKSHHSTASDMGPIVSDLFIYFVIHPLFLTSRNGWLPSLCPRNDSVTNLMLGVSVFEFIFILTDCSRFDFWIDSTRISI